MARAEEPLTRDGSPLRDFALGLRGLRHAAHLTYSQLARRAGYSSSSLQEAAAGRRLPTLNVTIAYVLACGGDESAWRSYWIALRHLLDRGQPSDPSRRVTLPSSALAPQAAPGLPTATDEWHLESFDALLRLDGPVPEAIERRVAVSDIDGLSELAASTSVPRHREDATEGHRLEVELLQGGALKLRQRPHDTYFRHIIALPRPLLAGQKHEYTMRLRLPSGQLMAPHYVHVPHRRSDHFRLTVRFDVHHPPAAVWELNGVPSAVIYEREPNSNTLVPDRIGEVHVEFRHLRQGLGYGLSWRP
jgi:hypothetical protein